MPLALADLLNLQGELSPGAARECPGACLSLPLARENQAAAFGPGVTASLLGSCLSQSFLWGCLRHFRALPSSSPGLSVLQDEEGATDPAFLALIMVKEVFRKSQTRRGSPAEELTPAWAPPDRLGL